MVVVFIYDLLKINCDAKFLESIIRDFHEHEKWLQAQRIKYLRKIAKSFHASKDDQWGNLKPFLELLHNSALVENANTVRIIRREYMHY